MKMQDVKSSNIKAVGYDPASQTMEVHFANGNKYQFLKVSPEKHQKLMAADSKGTHFHKHIRFHHDFEKL